MNAIDDRMATLALGFSSFALAMAPILLLFWLMQPKVLANPGIGALGVAKAASWEPFLQEPPLRESLASLAQDGPQYRQPETPAKRELRASNRKPSRLAQQRKTIASPLPARPDERQEKLAAAAGGKAWLIP
jgi:hypothetical protein